MSTPVIVDSTAFDIDANGVLYAWRISDGREYWHRRFSVSNYMSSPRYADGSIFGGGLEGGLARWSVASGLQEWRAEFRTNVGDPPVAIGSGIVYTTRSMNFTRSGLIPNAGGARGFLRTLERWRRGGTLSMLLAGRFSRQEVIALDAKTGVVLWRQDLGVGADVDRNHSGTPVLVDTTLLVASPISRTLTGLRSKTGERLWQAPLPARVVGAVLAVDGLVFSIAADGRLRAHDLQSGEARGSCDLGTPGGPYAPVLIGSSVLLPARGGIAIVAMQELREALRRGISCGPALKGTDHARNTELQ